MSFKDDYKSAFGAVSPDTEKIITGVHERLNENAPMKLRVNQNPPRKKPVWAIIGSVAGAAACVALAITVVVKVVPNLAIRDEMNGAAAAPEYNGAAGGNLANDGDVLDGTFGIDSGYNAEYAESIVLEINADNILDAEEVYINGYRYVKANAFTMYDIPEGLLFVKSTDGRAFYVYIEFEDDVVLIADINWKQNNQVWGFVLDRERYALWRHQAGFDSDNS